MAGYRVLAIYRSHGDAERARVRLIKEGVRVGNIRVVTAREAAAKRSSVFSRPDSNEWYLPYLHGDRAAVSVRTHSVLLRQRAGQILDALKPLDEDEIAAEEPAAAPSAEARPMPTYSEGVPGAAPRSGGVTERSAATAPESRPATDMAEAGATPGDPAVERHIWVRPYPVWRRNRE